MIRKNGRTAAVRQTYQPTDANARTDTFLLVEDDAQTARVMSRLLNSVGVGVEAVGTVKEGLAALSRIPAVVILDLMLPDGSGVQVLEAIREANLRCKVAIVSGSTDAETFKRVSAAKPDAIFHKPLDFEDFVQWLCEAFPEAGEGEAAGEEYRPRQVAPVAALPNA